jgi:hypothetical protein
MIAWRIVGIKITFASEAAKQANSAWLASRREWGRPRSAGDDLNAGAHDA